MPMPTQITPPEFFEQSMQISNDLDRVSGVTDYQRGAQTAIKRTATEGKTTTDEEDLNYRSDEEQDVPVTKSIFQKIVDDLTLTDDVVQRLNAATDDLKTLLGPDPDMWAKVGGSRYR